jgi:hypothetical protein
LFAPKTREGVGVWKDGLLLVLLLSLSLFIFSYEAVVMTHKKIQRKVLLCFIHFFDKRKFSFQMKKINKRERESEREKEIIK